MRGLLSEDLRWIRASSGAIVTKRQLVAAASHAIPDIKLDYEVDSITTWERGGVAGVDYILTNSRTFRDYRTVFVARASDTYARQKGQWQLLRQ